MSHIISNHRSIGTRKQNTKIKYFEIVDELGLQRAFALQLICKGKMRAQKPFRGEMQNSFNLA